MMRIEVGPSLRLASILFLAHLLAIVLVLYLSLPILIVPVLVIGMIHSILHYALLAFPDSIVLVNLGEENCVFFTRSGGEFRASLLGSTFVSPWLSVMNLKPAKGRARALLILPDSMGKEEFRRLRVWLRWKT